MRSARYNLSHFAATRPGIALDWSIKDSINTQFKCLAFKLTAIKWSFEVEIPKGAKGKS